MELPARQHFGQMHGADRAAARATAPRCNCIRQLESSDTTVSAPVRRMLSILVRAIAARHARELHGERAAEPAALLRGVHLAQREILHARQQSPGTLP